MRTFLKIGIGVLCVAALGAFYVWGPVNGPSNQPPPVKVDSQTLLELRAEFDRTASENRIILLLSPT
jgi:hypothetical protein